MKDLTRFRPDGLAIVVTIVASLAAIVVVLFATTLRPLWMILVSGALVAGLAFLAVPQKRMALWSLYVLALPLGAAKAITTRPHFFFGENPDGFVLNLPDLPLLALGVWWLAERVLGKAPKPNTTILLPLLATLVWRALTITVAPDKSLAAWNVLSHMKFAFVVYWAATYLNERRWINLTIGLFMADLLIQASINVASFYIKGAITVFGIVPYGAQQIGGSIIYRATGTMGPHNSQIQFYEMLIPLALVLLYRAPHKITRAISAITIVLTVLASAFTFSRGGWIGVLIALGTATWFLYQRRLISTALLAAIAGLGALSVAAFVLGPENIIGKRLTDTPGEAGSSRWTMNGVALRIIRDHPLMGIGTNNGTQVYGDYFPEGVPKECYYIVKLDDYHYEKHILPIHNRYLATAAERGLVGLALYLWFLYAYVWTSLRIIRSKDPWLASMGIWLVGANAGVLLHNLINEFTWLNIMEFHYLLAGVAAAIYALAIREGSLAERARRRSAHPARWEPASPGALEGREKRWSTIIGP